MKKAMRLRRTQSGVVLFIALIVLVAMTLAGIAIMRSVDTGNQIAGNVGVQAKGRSHRPTAVSTWHSISSRTTC